MRLLLILLIFLCFNTSNSQDTDYSALSLDSQLVDNANAVVRLDDIYVELLAIKEMSVRVRRVVTVLNKNGNRHLKAMVGYNNSIKVKGIEARIYDALGNEIEKFKEKDFIDVSAVDGGTLYSDSRLKYLDYTPIAYPYTVEFKYEIHTGNTANIPPWYFLDGFLVSTEKSRYALTYHSPDLKPIIKEKNLEGIVVSKTDADNTITYLAENIHAIKSESLSPSFSKIAPKLMVRAENFHYEGYNASINNWKDVGDWMYQNLIKDQSELSEATINNARYLVRGVSDPLEKARIIYEYVQANTRYISVQIGIGGLQPISAIEVDRVKYGDCKGLSNYTKSLLEAVGVTAYYTHVEAGRDKVDFEEDFPDLSQGNHVILAIPNNDQYYWIDCTSQVHPFGFIGDFTDDRKVLVITPEGGELATTPSYLNENNYQKTIADYALGESGGIKANLSIVTAGIQYDNRFFLEEESPKEITTYYKEYWSNINNLKLGQYQFTNDKKRIEFTENVALEAANYASKTGDRILFAINAFNKNQYVPDRYRSRKLPFVIQRGFLDEDESVVGLPKGYKIEAIPKSVELESEFGSYHMTVAFQEESNTLKYSRSLLIKKGVYPKEKYKEYRAFRKQVNGSDNAKIVLIKDEM